MDCHSALMCQPMHLYNRPFTHFIFVLRILALSYLNNLYLENRWLFMSKISGVFTPLIMSHLSISLVSSGYTMYLTDKLCSLYTEFQWGCKASTMSWYIFLECCVPSGNSVLCEQKIIMLLNKSLFGDNGSVVMPVILPCIWDNLYTTVAE